ncbi:MAG: tetratricopeptide repeat protein [Bacteroidales bacterium]
MKRNILSLLIIAAVAVTFTGCAALEGAAQKGKVSSALNLAESGELEKAKEAIDEALEGEATKDWPKTYYAQGRVAQTMWEKGYENDNEKLMTTYDNQLIHAYDSYLKSIELDDGNSMENLVIIQLPALANDFLAWAAREFENENFGKATMAFEELIDLQQSDVYIGSVDTAVVYNTALAAYNDEDYDKAIKYLDWSIELEYGETTPYILKYQACMNRNDLDCAEMALREAFEAFPSDEQILLTMIQFFIDNDKKDDALDYIELAIKDSPDNHQLYYARGVLHMQTENYDKALVALKKSIELKEDFFESHYNAGVCYYNKGAELIEEANNLMDPTEYNEAISEARDVFESALPYMERARELDPDDMDTLVSLKELYYRLQMTEKYEEVNARIKELEGDN